MKAYRWQERERDQILPLPCRTSKVWWDPHVLPGSGRVPYPLPQGRRPRRKAHGEGGMKLPFMCV